MWRLRQVAVLLVVFLVATACGGGQADETEPSTAPSVIDQPMIFEPWTTVPDPGPPQVPFLLGSSTGLDGLESICLSVDLHGFTMDEEELADILLSALDLLGLSTPTDDCQAILAVVVNGVRQEAEYYGTGTCWTGVRIDGATTLLVGDEARTVWEDSWRLPPPDSVFTCNEQSDTIGRSPFFAAGSLVDPFVDMFGDLGGFAIEFSRSSVSQRLLSDEAIQALASSLAREQGTAPRIATWEKLTSWVEEVDTFKPLIPHLIALLECPYPCALSLDDATERRQTVLGILRDITGASYQLREPADWWDRWEEERR